MLQEQLKLEQTLLRQEIIKRISEGNFTKLYSLLKDILPITQEEKTQIIVNWYANNKNIIISNYLIPLIDQNYELIKDIDENMENSFKR